MVREPAGQKPLFFGSIGSIPRCDRLSGAMNIKFCKKCIMPDSRPRIVFDENGICNACHNAEEKIQVDWESRKLEFLELIKPYRSKVGNFDCIVPWSGGKDSSSIAHKLKFEFGMNPLLVTFSPLIPNKVGEENRESMLRLGYDNLHFRPNQKVSRHLARRFFLERGNQKVHWDAGVNAVPVQVAVNYQIPLVFYAEHAESEYGGRVLHQDSIKIRDFTEVIEHQVGDDPRNWVDDLVGERDLIAYTYPDLDQVRSIEVKALYFGYFFRWSMFENYQYIKDKFDFKLAEGGRTEGTFTNFDSLDDKTDSLYYYMQFVKFGFGRATRDACRMIQNNQLTREKGLEFALKYDSEYPQLYLKENLEYLNLSKSELDGIIDQHRNQEIWKNDKNKWTLRFPPQ